MGNSIHFRLTKVKVSIFLDRIYIDLIRTLSQTSGLCWMVYPFHLSGPGICCSMLLEACLARTWRNTLSIICSYIGDLYKHNCHSVGSGYCLMQGRFWSIFVYQSRRKTMNVYSVGEICSYEKQVTWFLDVRGHWFTLIAAAISNMWSCHIPFISSHQ